MKARSRSRRTTTNLEARVSSFVGRAGDVAALAERLENGRLVTVVGPGGIGKTSVALRLAEERVAARSGARRGTWLCDLSEASTAADIVAVVAASLGVSLVGLADDAALAEALGHAIARKGPALLVLDNFDRLVAHAPETVGLWLRSAPAARFLVTSRSPLDLPGEQIWPLAPLARDEAIELFARRARAVQPSFDASSEHEAVGEIVDAIDCMPLAIELAATRMTLLSTTQLRDRLDRPLELLAGRRAPERHGSMRRTVLDSVELLGPSVRALFARSSVLRNGFTLEAAEAILEDDATTRDDVMRGLDALARSSLLRVTVAPGEPARYALFETIRDVAEELAVGDATGPRRLARHASYYAGLCARLGRDGLPRAAQIEALAHELENALRAHHHASELATSKGAPERAAEVVSIALGLDPLLSARGLSPLRVRLLDDAISALDATGSTDDVARAEAHLARGFARRELGDAILAREDFERALSLAKHTHQPGLAAVALMRLGGIHDVLGDTVEARLRFAEALALLEDTPRGALRTLREAEAYLRLGHAHRREGALDPARAAVIESTERYRRLGHDEGWASAIYEHAVIEMFVGDHARAFALFDEGLRVARRSGGVQLMMGALTTARGCLLQDVGRLDEALEHHAEAARTFREVGSRYREGSALYYLATTYLERGNAAEAESILHRALERVEGVGASRYEALMAAASACALVALGRFDAAESAMARAESAAARVRSEPALATTVRIHRLALDLRARGLRDAASVVAEAEALVATSASDDSRFALRALRALVTGAPADSDALVVRLGGGAFSVPGSRELVTLPERSPLRRILEHLARRRIDAPGEVVTIEDVIRAGWPSEKIGAEAALNRAYVALAALRKKGLAGLLVHAEGGYSLSRAVVVRMQIKGD